MTLTTKKKLELKSIFMEAAIAHELTGEWRHVFKYYQSELTGSLHRSCSRWAVETDQYFEEVMRNYDTN